MNAEIEFEKKKIIGEWVRRAADDLESAKLILKETDSNEIAAYHAHQAIEKALKARLLSRGETFRFIHDLKVIFRQVFDPSGEPEALEKIVYVNALYPKLRYPTGDKITKEQAEKCVEAAEEIFSLLKALDEVK
jgi:HEPN domain-containing protein